MQRVSSLLPSWERRPSRSSSSRSTSGAFDKVFGWGSSNRASATIAAAPGDGRRVGREVYWPTNLDKECEKAARILTSFCTDGFLAQDVNNRDSIPASPSSPTQPSSPHGSMKKIPPRIIQNAVGLAIFSCMRSGLWMSGSGGSGILIARKADGTWSPPSGILLHTAALGFVIGVDIYDCVLVINDVAALELFTGPKLTLGTDISLSVGPLVTSGLLENDVKWKELKNTVLTYLKAKGQHRSVKLDGSFVTRRDNENERFYSSAVGVLDILAGIVDKAVPEIRPLFEAIKAAEGRTDYDSELMDQLSQLPAPGDALIESPSIPMSPTTLFGIPAADDPDPFGVIALEMAGLEIREAGSKTRPASTQFEYNPSPASPVYAKFNRQSADTSFSRSNRGSYTSTKTHATGVTDAGTQTAEPETPETTFSPNHSDDGREQPLDEKLPTVYEPEEVDYTKVDMSSVQHLSSKKLGQVKVEAHPQEHEAVQSGMSVTTDDESRDSSFYPEDDRDEDADDEDDEDDEEEPLIFEVAAAAQPARAQIQVSQVTQVIHAKGALVNIPKRVPPPLPMRNPARSSRGSKSDFGDVSSLKSPSRRSFQSFQSDKRLSQVAESETQTSPVDTPSAEEHRQPKVDAVLTADKPESLHKTAGDSRVNTDSVPPTPTTPQATERASSVEDSGPEPQTPRADENIQQTNVDEKTPTLRDGPRVQTAEAVEAVEETSTAVA